MTREQGLLAADACSAYGAPTTIVGTPAQSGLATGCYRFVLTGIDNVGNTVAITTIVKVDTSAPAAPGLVLSDSSADVHTTGTTAFYRPAGTGSFDVTASSTDAESGVLDYAFPALAGFTGSGAGATRTYTLATPTEPNGAKPVTARNQALLSSTRHQLHPHLRLGRAGQWRADGQHASPLPAAAPRATTTTAPSRSARAPTTPTRPRALPPRR